MKIKIQKSPQTCDELSALIGYKVKELTTEPDGSMEIDIEPESLTSSQIKSIIDKLKASQIHLV